MRFTHHRRRAFPADVFVAGERGAGSSKYFFRQDRQAPHEPATLSSSTRAWIDGYALKFFGCVRMCRLFWPMLKAVQGFVVNIGGGAE
jgi:hypothetical protein